MKLPLLLSVSISAMAIFGCGSGNSSGNKEFASADSTQISKEIIPAFPITINVKEEYPKKEVAWEEIAEISYIKLGKLPTGMMQFEGDIFMTENDLFCRDKTSVLRFDHSGNFKNSIGRAGRGPGEVALFISFMVDTLAQEVYMSDITQQKFVVYNYEGVLKREFRRLNPAHSSDIVNISDSTLLIDVQLKPWSDRPMTPGRLYAEISNKDGKEIQRIGPWISEDNEQKMISMKNLHLYFKDELILRHSDSDIIYSTKPAQYPNMTFTPRYIIDSPKSNEKERRDNVVLWAESDKYAFAEHTNVNMTKMVELMKAKKPTSEGQKRRILMIDKKSGEIYEPKLSYFGKEFKKLPSNIGITNVGYSSFNAHELVEKLEKNELADPKLIEIATSLTENDNPVLIIFKFKN